MLPTRATAGTEEKVSQDAKLDIQLLEGLEERIKNFRQKHMGTSQEPTYLRIIIEQFESIAIPTNIEDKQLNKRIVNLRADIALFRLKEKFSKLCLEKISDLSFEDNTKRIKFIIAELKKLQLLSLTIAELKVSLTGLEASKYFVDKASRPILEAQLTTVKDRLDFNTSVIKAISDYEKQLQELIAYHKQSHIENFKSLLRHIYLIWHNQESLDKLKDKLKQFNNLTDIIIQAQSIEPDHAKSIAQGSTTSAVVQQELKQNLEAKKSQPPLVKTEENAMKVLGNALLGQLEMIGKLKKPKQTRILGIDVCPALYYGINWNHEDMIYLLLENPRKTATMHGVAKLLIDEKSNKTKKIKIDCGGFLEFLKLKLNASDMPDAKFLTYLQVQGAKTSEYKNASSTLAPKVKTVTRCVTIPNGGRIKL